MPRVGSSAIPLFVFNVPEIGGEGGPLRPGVAAAAEPPSTATTSGTAEDAMEAAAAAAAEAAALRTGGTAAPATLTDCGRCGVAVWMSSFSLIAFTSASTRSPGTSAASASRLSSRKRSSGSAVQLGGSSRGPLLSCTTACRSTSGSPFATCSPR